MSDSLSGSLSNFCSIFGLVFSFVTFFFQDTIKTAITGLNSNCGIWIFYLFVFFSFFPIVIIFYIVNVKSISIGSTYRFDKKPERIELSVSEIKKNNQEKISITIFTKPNKILNWFYWLSYKFIVQISNPFGIIVTYERNNSDFDEIKDQTTTNITLSKKYEATGKRCFILYLKLDSNSSFQGGDNLIVNISIMPFTRFDRLNRVFQKLGYVCQLDVPIKV